MRNISSATIPVTICLGLFALRAAADQLPGDYAQFEKTRESLEEQRDGYEQRLEQDLKRWHDSKTSWNNCVEKITFPERICWEEPRIEAGIREQSLEQKRRSLEKIRLDLERERMVLEQRRQDIEARFTAAGRGSRYETEFRSYMQDLSVYLEQVKESLVPQYSEYIEQVGGYVGFLDQQSNACKVLEPCQLAEQYKELSSQRDEVEQVREQFERRLNKELHPGAPVPAMLRAAGSLWAQYTKLPRNTNRLREDKNTDELLEAQRTELEDERLQLELHRGQFGAQRINLEQERQQLEHTVSGNRRGSAYQTTLLDDYIGPMSKLLEGEMLLLANYKYYENAILAYVLAVKEVVGADPRMQEVVAATFEEFAEEEERLDEVREEAQTLTSAGTLIVAAATSTAAAETVDAAVSTSEREPTPEESGEVEHVFAKLLEAYVDLFRVGVSDVGDLLGA